jgi:peptide/nickel transport system substrate-binding protein
MNPVLWRRMALAAMALATLSACAGEEEGLPASAASFCEGRSEGVESFLARSRAAGTAPADPRAGGTAVVAGGGEIASGTNVFGAPEYLSVQHQQFVNLMTLIAYDEASAPVPYLAESWEVSEDGTEVTFHLRQDVFWHDGEQTDAHDVAFTYLRVTDPRTAFGNPSYFANYEPGETGVEVVDDFTVRVRMRPHADFMDPWHAVAIMPEHLLGDVPPEELAQHPFGTECPVGNGPFVFVEHRPGDRWIFEANPAFPEGLGGPPLLDRLVYRVIPDQTTLLAELLTGGIDVYHAPNADQAQRIMDEPGLELRRFTSRAYSFIAWNTRKPQLADARVRRAFTLGLDRGEVVAALLGGLGQVADQPVPPFHWAHDPDLAGTPYDPARARRLLEEAGWTDADGDGVRENPEGERLSVVVLYNQGNRTRQAVAEIMQAQLAEVGVEIVPQVAEFTTMLSQIFDGEARDYEGAVLAWTEDFRIDNTDLFHSDRVEGPTAMAGLQNPEIDRYLDTLQLVMNRDEARPLWHEYLRLLDAEHPYTFLYYPEALVGMNRRLRGAEMDARGEWRTVRGWWIDAPSEGG